MANSINFQNDMTFEYGKVESLSKGVRRLVAKNPSPFTFHGTNTYILGSGEVAVIDPGPALPEHIDALVKGLEGEIVTHILITHTHNDHSPGAAILKEYFPAPCIAYGPHGSGHAESGLVIEEGGDMAFTPDALVRDGDVVKGKDWSVECVYTPGHTSNHMCYQLIEEKALFTGDHIMGWSTSVIVPPDGHMGQYLESLNRLLARDDQVYWPAHGPAITDPKGHVKAFIAHRQKREKEILRQIESGQHKIMDMVAVMYKKHPKSLHPAAAMSVLASIISLLERGLIRCSDQTAKISSRYQTATGEA